MFPLFLTGRTHHVKFNFTAVSNKKKSLHVFTKVFFFPIPPRGANQFQKPPPSLHSTRVYFNFVTPPPFPYFNEFQFCLHSQGELFFFHQTFPDENRRLKSSSSLSCKVNKLCIVLRIRLQD